MRTHHRCHPIHVLSLVILITSCNAQEGSTVPQNPASTSAGAAASEQRPTDSTSSTRFDNVHAAIQDRAGNLWFTTTSEGVYRYDGKTFTRYTEKDGLSSNRVWAVLEDRAGIIWFGTGNGICRYDGKIFSALHIPTGHGADLLPPEEANPTASTDPAVPTKRMEVFSIYQDRAGTLWFGTEVNGVYRYDGKTMTSFLRDAHIVNNSGLRLNNISAFQEDKAGHMWFASWNNEGVCRYDGTSLINYKLADGFPDNMVHCILEDRNGTLWFGTREHGVFRYDEGRFINFTEKEGIARSPIASMLQDSKGHLWFATDKNGAWRYDGKTFTPFTTKEGLGNNSVFCIVEDRAGNLWFGTRNVGLCRYDGKSFTDFSEKMGGR